MVEPEINPSPIHPFTNSPIHISALFQYIIQPRQDHEPQAHGKRVLLHVSSLHLPSALARLPDESRDPVHGAVHDLHGTNGVEDITEHMDQPVYEKRSV